jgi:hypothetical protein
MENAILIDLSTAVLQAIKAASCEFMKLPEIAADKDFFWRRRVLEKVVDPRQAFTIEVGRHDDQTSESTLCEMEEGLVGAGNPRDIPFEVS